MASVLSLPVQLENSLPRYFAESMYGRSWTSSTDNVSSGTVQRRVARTPSPASITSTCSLPAAPVSRCRENESASLPSRQFLDVAARDVSESASEHRRASIQVPVRPVWSCTISPPTSTSERGVQVPSQKLHSPPTIYRWPSIPTIMTPDETDENNEEVHGHGDDQGAISTVALLQVHEKGDSHDKHTDLSSSQMQPHLSWWNTIRRRRAFQSTHATSSDADIQQAEEEARPAEEPISPLRTPEQRGCFHSDFHSGHRKSLSLSSSMGLLSAVNSASMTIASTSIAPTSRRRAFSGLSSRDHSEFSGPRSSVDSTAPSIGANIDLKALERSVRRRRIVEEIVATEEDYVNDMKALYNNFCTLPPRVPNDRKLIHNAINAIIQLHEELLKELQKAIPHVDSVSAASNHRTMTTKRHLRLRSADTVPVKSASSGAPGRHARRSTDNLGQTSAGQGHVPSADPQIAMDVAKVFDKLMRHFLAYEAYAAQRDTMDRDAASMSKIVEEYKIWPKDMPKSSWNTFSRGGEAVQRFMASSDQRLVGDNKALTFSDLLSKPIQRICKYPLFFRELCKQTPACDDPVTHDELQKIVFRLEETIAEINKAKDNPSTRRLIETTWRLQDRFQFEGHQELPKSMILRLLGHVQLCGVLHVAYELKDRITGQYMLSVLYRAWLVLAIPDTSKTFGAYAVAAVIPLVRTNDEAADNNKGLQCHTAPFTWKLVFEYCSREYEVILSACSEKEEMEWRTRIKSRIAAEGHDFQERRISAAQTFSFLNLELRPMGLVADSHTLNRCESVQRAATVGPKSNLRQVIIKNTAAQKDARSSKDMETAVGRSQSHLSSNNMPTLIPRRVDRSRLEHALTDVWSKDVLPYPGMPNRVENLRASANSVMRKMSMASITSNFSKRSASMVSNASQFTDDTRFSSQKSIGSSKSRVPKSSSGENRRNQKLVDFHNAPEQFLPEDFELKNESEGRRRVFFPRTGLGSQPSTPPPPTPTKSEGRKSSQHRLPGAENVSPSQLPISVDGITTRKSAGGVDKSTPTDDSSPSRTQSTPSANRQVKRPFKSKSRLFNNIARIWERPHTPHSS